MSTPISTSNIMCNVDPPEDEFGEFANAFRYALDGNEVLLDFCVYSERDQRARVVSRVRVSQALFSAIYQQLSDGVTPLPTLYPTLGES